MNDIRAKQLISRIAKETNEKLYIGMKQHWDEAVGEKTKERNVFFNFSSVLPISYFAPYSCSAYDVLLNHLLELCGYKYIAFSHSLRDIHKHFSWREHILLRNILKNEKHV